MAFKRSSNSAGDLQATFDSGTAEQKAAFQASVSGDSARLAGNMLQGLFDADCMPGHLTALRAAIAAGTAKICFAGDSNTEDGDNIDPSLNLVGTHRQIIQEKLLDFFPTVAWSFPNYGLRSRTLGMFASATYTGQTGAENQATGFLRTASTHPYWGDGTGSVSGKTWLNHVRDAAPDAVVLHFGLNPQLDLDFAAALDTVRTAIAGWAKVPSIIIVAPMRPHPLYQDQYRPQRLGRLIRYYARRYGWALIDTCRVHNIIRDGFDETAGDWVYHGANNLTWSNEWIAAGGTVTAPDNFTRVFGANSFLRLPINAHDVSIQMTVDATNTGVTGIPHLRARDESQLAQAGTFPGYAWGQQTGFSIRAYDGAVDVGSFTTTAAAGDTLIFKCLGSRLELWIRKAGQTNWARGVAVNQFKNNAAGHIVVGSFGGTTGGLVMSNPRILYATPRRMSPVVTDETILGPYNNGALTLNMPYGGNGANHPGTIGTRWLFGPGYSALMRALM